MNPFSAIKRPSRVALRRNIGNRSFRACTSRCAATWAEILEIIFETHVYCFDAANELSGFSGSVRPEAQPSTSDTAHVNAQDDKHVRNCHLVCFSGQAGEWYFRYIAWARVHAPSCCCSGSSGLTNFRSSMASRYGSSAHIANSVIYVIALCITCMPLKTCSCVYGSGLLSCSHFAWLQHPL